MAEGWARALHPGTDAYSAGTHPGTLDARAVRAMAEAGVDISAQRPKSVDDLSGPFDLVVTVCDAAREACPWAPSLGPVRHMGFEDPPRLAAGAENDEQAMTHYRRVRDEIRRFVETLDTTQGEGT